MGQLRRFVILTALTLATGLAAIGLGGCGDSLPAGDLILVSVDTLRADRMSLYGAQRPTDMSVAEAWSPRWLAARGTAWEWCWAPAGKTTPSLASFWTGLEPLEHGAVDHAMGFAAPSYAERFQAAGYATLARVANMTLVPQAFGKGFDSYAIRARVDEPEVYRDLLRLSAEPIRAQQPLLLWAHFMAPHQPYTPPEANRLWARGSGPPGDKEVLQALNVDPARATPQVVDHLRGLYDGEVLTASQFVQRLLEGLDRHYREAGRGGLLENATVVFFSDHGEELADRFGYFMHAKSLFTGVIRVPLVIAGPGYEAGARDEQPVGLLDLLPLVVDGRAPARDTFVATWKNDFYSIRDARWTLVHNPCGRFPRGPREPPLQGAFPYAPVALFDRRADPAEQTDVAREHPQVTRRLLGALRAWYAGLDLAPRAPLKLPPGLTPEQMAELGYIDGSVTEVCEPWTPDQWQPR